MKKDLRFFAVGIFALMIILGLWFVAANASLAPLKAGNGTIISVLWFNVSAASTLGNNLTNITINNTGTSLSGSNITNITLSNGTLYYPSSCCTFPVTINIGAINNTTATTGVNFTLNFTLSSSAANNATIQANITAFVKQDNVTFQNSSNINSTIVTIDAARPDVTSVAPTANANLTGTADVLNATVTDYSALSSVRFNITNGTASWSWLISATNTSASSWNATLNTTNLTDGSYNVTVIATDEFSSINSSVYTSIKADNTNPSATPSCSPTSVQTGDTFPCSCSGSDATSGVNTTSASSTSSDGTSRPSVTGTFTYTCSATDFAGNSASSSTTYSVTQTPGSGPSQGTPTTPPVSSAQSFTKITPGAASIAKDFNSEIGVKQIEITVNNEAQNVKITVTKYDNKPAEVSVSKTGKVYQYVQIDATNLADKLDKAKVQFRVEKSWATTNGVSKENVVVSKFDEANKKWSELATTYASEDNTYYYYDVTLDSFSYFAISEKAVVVSGEGEGAAAGGEEGRNLTWLWIVIAVIVIALIWWFVASRKKQ